MKYKNILLIDDDSDDCEFFEQAFREVSDSTYTSLQNPVQALSKLMKHEIMPDLIYMDINMPLMSGTELLIEIKKRKPISHIPIILLSTSSMLSKIAAQDLGAQDFLVKPSNLDDLKVLIKNSIT